MGNAPSSEAEDATYEGEDFVGSLTRLFDDETLAAELPSTNRVPVGKTEDLGSLEAGSDLADATLVLAGQRVGETASLTEARLSNYLTISLILDLEPT